MASPTLLSKSKTQGLYQKAKELIPGGTQLLSKRPEMFLPEQWPAYYAKAQGCDVWDLDGNKFVDMAYMGIGSCILGYADHDVNRAVEAAVRSGNMTTLNVPEEVELAQLLIALHPWAEQVRYARTGGEAMAIAVRIARAATGRDRVLFCGYHGWHDWYLSANLRGTDQLKGHLLDGLNPHGVPEGLAQTALPFAYNDLPSFNRLFDEFKGDCAAVVMEPMRHKPPVDGFLDTIRQKTREAGVPLIFDEITTGWRFCLGGLHLKLNVTPDIVVFGKAMTNGFPMAAVVGIKELMQKAEECFISSTYWTDRIGPTAALAAIKKLKENRVNEYLATIGRQVQNGWEAAAKKNQLKITIAGQPALTTFSFDEAEPLAFKSLFTQFMLEKGYLATNAFYASFAHKTDQVARYVELVDEAFEFLAQAKAKGRVKESLKGPVCHAGFKRLT